MRIAVVCVGKLKERGLRDLADDYLTRIRRHIPCDEIEVREGKNEEASIRAAIPSGASIVAMEIKGRCLDSAQFADRLQRMGTTGKGVVAFLIGGADGIPESISKQAADRWSMSSLTLSHRIARVVLMEQIYRATTIWRGEPYHR